LKAKYLKPAYRYFLIRIKLEKQRLWNWSEMFGFLKYLGGKQDALDMSLTGLNCHLILEVMLQIQALLKEFI
jgi:hypothetical protein